MTPEQINAVGFYIFYILRIVTLLAAVWAAWQGKTLATWILVFLALCLEWNPDGRWVPKLRPCNQQAEGRK